MASHWEKIGSGMMSPGTPEELWQSACDYFAWCDRNDIKTSKTVTGGRGASEVDEKHHRPYTVRGLCIHCGINEDYIKDIKSTKERNSAWYLVMERILYIIHTQNTEMAMVGAYNAIFTSKILGMEKEEDSGPTEIRIIHEQNLPNLSNSELEILQKIDSENELVKKRV